MAIKIISAFIIIWVITIIYFIYEYFKYHRNNDQES